MLALDTFTTGRNSSLFKWNQSIYTESLVAKLSIYFFKFTNPISTRTKEIRNDKPWTWWHHPSVRAIVYSRCSAIPGGRLQPNYWQPEYPRRYFTTHGPSYRKRAAGTSTIGQIVARWQGLSLAVRRSPLALTGADPGRYRSRSGPDLDTVGKPRSNSPDERGQSMDSWSIRCSPPLTDEIDDQTPGRQGAVSLHAHSINWNIYHL